MNDTASANRPSGSMSGGRALAEMLRLAGVGPMFGMGGFQLLPFYDAIRQLGLTHHLINDERSGAFAADAYARVTNRPGICDGTLGPGATNLVTGLVESLNAGTPMLAIAGDTNRAHAWKNMTQECRQADILRPAVKELIRLESTERIPELVRRAFAVATSGRPGPVLLDVPEDVCHGEHEFAPEEFSIDPATLAVPARRARPARDDVERAAALLAKAERPLVLAGGGVHLSGAQAALQALAELIAMPFAHTMSGKGGIACTHALSAGLFGRYSRIANDLIAASDCLLVVGCKLGEIATKRYTLLPPEIPIIHLDIAVEEIGRCAPAEIVLWGDAREGLTDLADALRSDAAALRARRAGYIAELPERMARWPRRRRRGSPPRNARSTWRGSWPR
jgi:acetolactate synthase-1/2/3 large subunit